MRTHLFVLVASLMLIAAPARADLTGGAPTADIFMWQGMQQHFVQNGMPCRGRTALAVSQTAVCYVAPDDTLRCAGRIGSKNFGDRFTDAGMTGVEQILLSPRRQTLPFPWFFYGPRTGLCVKKHDGSAWCRGSYNADGQYGNGTTSSSSDFTRWGCSNDLVAIGTGNWDQICALDHSGFVTCAGKSYGTRPAFTPGANHESFWVDPAGTLHTDDRDTFRASNGRSDCRVHPRSPAQVICHPKPNGSLECRQFPSRPDDLECLGKTPWFFGPNDSDLWGPDPSIAPLIVDGGTIRKQYPGVGICGGIPDPFSDDDFAMSLSCWLAVDGKVRCLCRGPANQPAGVLELFENLSIVAMATDPWSETVCAVDKDGALWCLGENEFGKLGTGSDDDVPSETRVQDAGSVRTGCEAPPAPPTPLPPPAPTGSCPCPGLTRLSFTTREGTGNCGLTRETGSTSNEPLACGGLYFGGGDNAVPLPVQQPDQSRIVFSASACTASGGLTLGPRSEADEGRLHCSEAGCIFGAPVPVVVGDTPPVSSCLVNVLSAPATGTANCATGVMNVDLSIDSRVYLTGDSYTDPKSVIPGVQPCPVCAPSLPGQECPGSDACGTCCHGGPNHLKPCTPGSSELGEAFPTSQDCPPEPTSYLATIPASFRLTTGTLTWTASRPTNDSGSTAGAQRRVFSGYCRDMALPGGTGSFDANSMAGFQSKRCWQNGMAVGSPCSEADNSAETCEQRTQGAFGPNGGAVRTIRVFGVGAGAIHDGQPHAATLGAIFSLAPTFENTLDAADNLPGPAAVSLQGDVQLLP
jgi:hypothetical protein